MLQIVFSFRMYRIQLAHVITLQFSQRYMPLCCVYEVALRSYGKTVPYKQANLMIGYLCRDTRHYTYLIVFRVSLFCRSLLHVTELPRNIIFEIRKPLKVSMKQLANIALKSCMSEITTGEIEL